MKDNKLDDDYHKRMYQAQPFSKSSYDQTGYDSMYASKNLAASSYDSKAGSSYQYGGSDTLGLAGSSFRNSAYKDVKRLPEDYSSLRQTFNISSNSRIRDMISKLDDDGKDNDKDKIFSSRVSKTDDLIRASHQLSSFPPKEESNKKFRDIDLEQKLRNYSSNYDLLNSQLENSSKVSQQIRKLKEERKRRKEQKEREKNHEIHDAMDQSLKLASSYSVNSLSGSGRLASPVRDKYEYTGNATSFKKKLDQYDAYTPKYTKKAFKDYQFDDFSQGYREKAKTTPYLEKTSTPYNIKRESYTDKNKDQLYYKLKDELSSSSKLLPSSSSNYTSTSKQVSSPMAKKIESSKYIEANGSTKCVQINGFVLGKSLGEGKFGVVYQAIHKATGWLFAIKKVPKQMIKSHMMEDQFILELKIQGFLNHENILSIYSVFDDKKSVYLVLEYMQGGTLFTHLKKNKTLPENEVAVKIKQIASALKYMHEKQIAHRDIKPENVVMSHGVCKLCDFGWATICDDRRKTYCGTFDYASPQILEGVEYDEKVDLWCLGVLTYELLFGKAPFYHISRKQTMKKILNVQNTAIEYPRTTSETAISFMDSLIRKDPKDRLSSDQLLEHPFLKYAQKK